MTEKYISNREESKMITTAEALKNDITEYINQYGGSKNFSKIPCSQENLLTWILGTLDILDSVIKGGWR